MARPQGQTNLGLTLAGSGDVGWMGQTQAQWGMGLSQFLEWTVQECGPPPTHPALPDPAFRQVPGTGPRPGKHWGAAQGLGLGLSLGVPLFLSVSVFLHSSFFFTLRVRFCSCCFLSLQLFSSPCLPFSLPALLPVGRHLISLCLCFPISLPLSFLCLGSW